MDTSKFLDYCKTKIKEDDFVLEDSLLSAMERKGLAVKFDASHAAIVNQNLRLYIPALMEAGTPSFSSSRRKPAKILKHHDRHADPVGIITDAEYIPTIPDSLKDNSDVQILCDSSASLKQQLDAAERFMRSGIPFQDGWEGLGKLRLKGIILDEETIKQVETGLFDAVSISFRPGGKVYCSVCKNNLVKTGFCEHNPGETYEDEDGNKTLCVWIPGEHNNDECSLVNFDADPLTTVEVGDSADDGKVFYLNKDLLDSSDSCLFECQLKDCKEDLMTINPNSGNEDNKLKELIKKLRPDANDEYVDSLVELVESKKLEDGKYPNQVEAEIDDDTAIAYILDNEETKDQTIDADAVYTELEKELDELELGDKKLSTEARKKLSPSTFCGPDKSFPVPDCCISGSTKIKLLDGTECAIKDLVGREDVWVYGFDTTKKSIVPAKVSKVWLAVKDAQIYKITLDNGRSIRCTGNHPFLTKSGEYIRADELENGQSLMPLYTRLAKNREGLCAYEQVYQPWYNFWEYTHHMSAREYFGKPLGTNEHIHHLDHNKRNNRPDNLRQANKLEHLKEHFVPGSRQNQVWTEFDKLCSEQLGHVKRFSGDEKLPVSAKASTAKRNMVARNHSVVSVELDGIEDAYDMEVPVTSNFGLADGIFVHNSHVTAGRRLLGRYKGPGDKTKILACINRKAKALGCGSSKKDEPETTPAPEVTMELPTCDMVGTLSNDDIRKLFHLAEAELCSRNLTPVRECSTCADNVNKAQEAINNAAELAKQVDELETQLTVLRGELKYQCQDYAKQVDQYVTQGLELKAEKTKRLALVAVLAGKQADMDAACEYFLDKDLAVEEAVLMDSFDVAKAREKINDGMDHVPEGTVDSPVPEEDNKVRQEVMDSLSPPARKLVELTQKLIKDGKVEQAKEIYNKIINMGEINPEVIPFRSLSADGTQTSDAED